MRLETAQIRLANSQSNLLLSKLYWNEIMCWYLADLEDNMDLSRLPTITANDKERFEKYKKAKEMLI